MPADTVYTVGREDAATQLGVSTRTLDRWLRGGKLKFRVINRSVYVHTGELAKILQKMGNQPQPTGNNASETPHGARFEPVFAGKYTPEPAPAAEEPIFKKLFEEAAADIRAKQEKLEAAHFRVGQLENQLKNSVPLLEHKQAQDELRQRHEELERANLTLTARLTGEQLKMWVAAGAAGVMGLVAIIFAILLLK